MCYVLDYRSLPSFKVCKTTSNFFQLSLDSFLSGLKPFKVLNNQVVCIFHISILFN